MKLPSLSSREKTLFTAVCGIVFVFGSGLLFNLFFTWSSELNASIKSKTDQLRKLEGLETTESLWKRRNAWLESKQPKLENRDNVGVLLLKQITNTAAKFQVLLDHQAIDAPDFRGDYVSVSVQLETKSSWPAVLDFLHELQSPEQFIVIESADYKIDDQDHTQMHGHVKIAKWYSIASGANRPL